MSDTLVALHGWGQDRHTWDELKEQFSKDHVVVFDLPGFGQEPFVSADWSIPEYGEWVKRKIADLNEKTVVLLGHSFGGRIASFIASENPPWLKKLVLYGAPCIYRPSLRVRLMIAAAKLARMLGLRRNDRSGMAAVFRKVVPFDPTHLLRKIKVPTLIVWGERDIEVPIRIAREMRHLIPNSKLTILEGAGHNAHLEHSNLFYGIIKTFIAHR